jgi:hypothetical protein
MPALAMKHHTPQNAHGTMGLICVKIRRGGFAAAARVLPDQWSELAAKHAK